MRKKKALKPAFVEVELALLSVSKLQYAGKARADIRTDAHLIVYAIAHTPLLVAV